MKRMIKASSEREYTVSVTFGGFIGGDETYTVYAEDEDDAIEQAKDEAEADLSATEVHHVEDDEYEVTVNFAGYIGVEDTYTVYAEDDEEAGILAEEEAASDLSYEIIDSDDDDEDEEEDEE